MLQAFDAKLLLGDRQRRLVGAGERRRTARNRCAPANPRRTGSRRAARRCRHRRCNRARGSRIDRAAAHIGRARRRPRAVRARAAAHRAPAATAAAGSAWCRGARGCRPPRCGWWCADRRCRRRSRRARAACASLVVVGGTDLHDGAGQAQPGGGVVRLRGDDLAEQRHAGAEIVLRKGGVGIAADLRHAAWSALRRRT